MFEELTDEQLTDQAKTMMSSHSWKCFSALLERKIHHYRDLLEAVKEPTNMSAIQAKIKVLRSILTMELK